MAHKMGAGSTKNNRDSKGKRLGLKCTQFQKVKNGSILIRQRGSTFKPGLNVKLGKDFTLYSTINGYLQFRKNIVNVFSISNFI